MWESRIPKQGKAARDRICSCSLSENKLSLGPASQPCLSLSIGQAGCELTGLHELSREASPRPLGNVLKCVIQKIQAKCQRIDYKWAFGTWPLLTGPCVGSPREWGVGSHCPQAFCRECLAYSLSQIRCMLKQNSTSFCFNSDCKNRYIRHYRYR